MKKLTINQFYYLGIIFIFVFGSGMHFIFNLLGQNIFIAGIVPVNESVFEHLKLAIIPTIIWYLWYYFSNQKVNQEKLLLTMNTSIIVTNLLILYFFYFLEGALGLESLTLDIISFFVAICLSQILMIHIYKFGHKIKKLYSWLLITFIIVLSAILTYFPPQLPIFKDINFNDYGIIKEK